MTGFKIETINNGNERSSQYVSITICVSKENLAIPMFQRYSNAEENNTRQKSIASASCISTSISTMNGNMVIKIFLRPDFTSIS